MKLSLPKAFFFFLQKFLYFIVLTSIILGLSFAGFIVTPYCIKPFAEKIKPYTYHFKPSITTNKICQ